MITDLQRVRFLRVAGITEGISFFVLLLLAMPLKYFFHLPEMVTIVGWIHGVLFITYLGSVALAVRTMRYSFFKMAMAWAAALLPVGTFLLDREWRQRELELLQTKTAAR